MKDQSILFSRNKLYVNEQRNNKSKNISYTMMSVEQQRDASLYSHSSYMDAVRNPVHATRVYRSADSRDCIYIYEKAEFQWCSRRQREILGIHNPWRSLAIIPTQNKIYHSTKTHSPPNEIWSVNIFSRIWTMDCIWTNLKNTIHLSEELYKRKND